MTFLFLFGLISSVFFFFHGPIYHIFIVPVAIGLTVLAVNFPDVNH